MYKRKKLIVGNWKMNPQTYVEAKKLFDGIKKFAPKATKATTVVCPPFMFISSLSKSYSGNSVFFGAQDIFYEERGAHTGEVSAAQVKDSGCKYVIIGHSERRHDGETDDEVQRKIKKALEYKLTPIVCVGESERDTHGKYLNFLREQISTALKGVKSTDVIKIVIAYEPIWAIGKTGSEAITSKKLHETTLFIRRVLLELYTKKIGFDIKILYGGSVKPANAEELLREGDVAGFLIGGASLEVDSFTSILKIAHNI